VGLGAVFPNDTKGKVLRPFKKYYLFGSIQNFWPKAETEWLPNYFNGLLKA
jgi:hypothetical protein